MSKNSTFVKTAKAEREGAKLPVDLKRMLSYFDGESSSVELAKLAPPSLRIKWQEHINELIKGQYIVERAGAGKKREPDRRESPPTNTPVPKPIASAPADNLIIQAAPALPPVQQTGKIEPISNQGSIGAEAASAVREPRGRVAEAVSDTPTERDKSVLASKTKPDITVKLQPQVEVELPLKVKDGSHIAGATHAYKWRTKFGVMTKSDMRRLRELEAENEILKQLLVEAYVERETKDNLLQVS